MDFRDDERGQPVVIGALLVFAILVLAFATYQGVVVPDQNAEVEYNHFQQVENKFSELRTSATNAIGSGEKRSVTIPLGTRYSPRLIALNPSAPSGSIETTGEGDVEIEGLEYSAADLCATDANQITSRSLRYKPSYHEHRSPESITYENTFRARSFRDGQTQFDGHSLVQPAEGSEPTRINLMVLTGSFSRSSGDSFDLDLNPTHRYGVVANPDGDFNVTLPSRFTAAQWENQILPEGEFEDVEQIGGRVKIRFSPGEYHVTCAALGLDSQPAYRPPGEDVDDPAFNTRWSEERTITVRPSREFLTVSMIATDRESGEPIPDAFVDYAYSGDEANSGEISFEGPQTGVTNESGENATTFDVSNSEDGDIYDIYATAGDDSDTISLNVQVARLTASHADDISEGSSVTQTFTIGLNEGIRAGDEVVVDLNDPHGMGGNQIRYPESDSSISTTGDGSVTYDSPSRSSYSVIYTVAESDAGSEFEIVVENIDSEGTAGQNYHVSFVLQDSAENQLDGDGDTFTVTAS